MTANHEHTPTTEEVKTAYRYDRTGKAIRLDDCSDPSIINADHNFDRWLATVEAAAEQRGAEAALREVANMSDAWQNLFRKDVSDQEAYMLAWRLRIALHNRADTYRTDQEVDDE